MTKTVLFISPVIPVPVNRGSALRTAMMIKTFVALGFHVHLALLNRSEEHSTPKEISERIEREIPGVTAHVITQPAYLKKKKDPALQQIHQRHMRALVREHWTLGHWGIQNLTEFPAYFEAAVNKLRAARDYDLIFVNYAKMLPKLGAGERKRTITDLHDVQFNRIMNDEYPKWHPLIRKLRFWWFRRSELRKVTKPGLLLSITNVEAAQLRPLLPARSKIAVFPAIAPEQPRRPARDDRPFNFLFIGSNSDANGASIVWFLRECWPQIRAARPEAKLLIQGAIIRNRELKALGKTRTLEEEGVEIRGFAEDLSETYDEADIVISPTVRGTGMKIKVIEALSYAKPVVGTDVAFDGIDIVDGENGRRANTAEGFVAACLELYDAADQRGAIADGAQALWDRDHSFEASKRYLTEALAALD